MRILKPVKNRKRQHLAVAPIIRARLKQIARENNCSMNLVENTILAKALHIDIGEAYDDTTATRKTSGKAQRIGFSNSRNHSIPRHFHYQD